MERVKAEFDWISEHKIEYIFCCDANFGLFDRDNEIADYIINLKVTTGYPKVFRVCFTKNRTDFVKMIGRKFNIYGLDKAQTLSFQSMSQPVLDNINRKNIPVENFKKLMRLYNKVNVATFSELILGLPGETRESFVEGLCSLIECGQHDSIFVYPCELLPNSQMGSQEYIEKFGIKTIKTPFDAVHVDNDARSDDIKEYSRFIISTDTLSVDDWVYCVVYSTMIQALHNMGLLRCIAVFTVTDFRTGKQQIWNKKLSDIPEYKDAGHGGGDMALARDFVNAVGLQDPGQLSSTIDVSLESHVMGFAAERSRKSGKKEKVKV